MEESSQEQVKRGKNIICSKFLHIYKCISLLHTDAVNETRRRGPDIRRRSANVQARRRANPANSARRRYDILSGILLDRRRRQS